LIIIPYKCVILSTKKGGQKEECYLVMDLLKVFWYLINVIVRNGSSADVIEDIAGYWGGFRFSSYGGVLKKFGVFRVKNHDFTPKNHIFSNFRVHPPPPGSASGIITIYIHC
jgi:hypothetical protein